MSPQPDASWKQPTAYGRPGRHHHFSHRSGPHKPGPAQSTSHAFHRAAVLFSVLVLPITVPAEAAQIPIGGEIESYVVEVDISWSADTHPGAYPTDGHFSWLAGATHNDEIDLWEPGTLASPGIVQMAETGLTLVLRDEVQAEIISGTAYSLINEPHWFCGDQTTAPQCGPHSFEIEVHEDFSLVTLVAEVAPSPDWFTGVDSLALRVDGQWENRIVVELFAYDAGTRSGNTFERFGPTTDPRQPIGLVTELSGQLIGPRPLGTITFTREGFIPEPTTFSLATLCLVAGGIGRRARFTARRSGANQARR